MPTRSEPPRRKDDEGHAADDPRKPQAKPSVFISYAAHEDEEWKDRLVKH